MRLFIAINLPEQERLRLSHALNVLASHDLAVRWVDADSLHITLKFLGEVAESRRGAVAAGLAQAIEGTAPFAVSVGQLGAFPSLARPNIVWVGVTAAPELMSLQDSVERNMTELGFEREARAFRPHITVGRVRKDGRIPDRHALDRMAESLAYEGGFRVEAVDLMRSRLGPRGARYEVLERMELF